MLRMLWLTLPDRRVKPIQRRHLLRRLRAWWNRMQFKSDLRYLPETKEPKR